MKHGKYQRWAVGIISLYLLLGTQTYASVASAARAAWELPNFDGRIASETATSLTNRAPALAQLRSRLPGVNVDFDELLSTPSWISSTRGFLSGPGGEGGAISSQSLASVPAGDPDRPTKAFLLEQRALFSHGPEVLASARVKRDFVTAHNGLHTKVWQQQFGDIPVFEAFLVSHTTAKGELVNISSRFLP